VRRVGSVAVVLAVALAGCTPPSPERVPGDPAPVTVAPSGGTAPAAGPTRQPGSPTPAGVPQLPTGYEQFALTGHGVTARLTVPSGWSRRPIKARPGAVGTEFVDPSGAQLFRVEITARERGRTARQGFEAYEPTLRRSVADYRRLDLIDVPGVGESAVDLSFTLTRDGGRRQVVDRMLVQGPAAVAVYYSTTQRDFERLVPIWQHAVARLVIESG
jgi:hypothetical protein